MERFTVCDRCAVGLTNDDWTWIDGVATDEDEADLIATSIAASVEIMGNVHSTDETVDGYGDCFVCDETVVDPQIWEGGSQ